MASLRRTKPLPIPGGDLARLKESLHPHYGSKVHEAPGPEGVERILVIRVPRPDPDMVNDVEQCVEYLSPGDLQEATSCLLVGDAHTLQYPPQPLRDLMAARVQSDKRHCHFMRGQMKPGEHRLFKSPDDPRRQVRLGLRLGRAKVAEVTEEDILAAARLLGPHLKSPGYKEARCVYLVADQDDVRMDADLFFQEVQSRWGEESERRRLAEEIVQKEAARRIQEEAERQRLLASRPRPEAPRVAVAPLRRSGPPAAWEATPDPRSPLHPLADRAAMYAHLDAMLGIGHPTARPTVPALPAPAAASPLPATPPPPPLPPPPPTHLQALQKVLQGCGFDVLVKPPVAAAIDLAAERAGAHPQRVVAYCPERLDVAMADRAIATAKALQADLALVVCAEAEPEARKRLVATRVRWVDPAGLPDLQI